MLDKQENTKKRSWWRHHIELSVPITVLSCISTTKTRVSTDFIFSKFPRLFLVFHDGSEYIPWRGGPLGKLFVITAEERKIQDSPNTQDIALFHCPRVMWTNQTTDLTGSLVTICVQETSPQMARKKKRCLHKQQAELDVYRCIATTWAWPGPASLITIYYFCRTRMP